MFDEAKVEAAVEALRKSIQASERAKKAGAGFYGAMTELVSQRPTAKGLEAACDYVKERVKAGFSKEAARKADAAIRSAKSTLAKAISRKLPLLDDDGKPVGKTAIAEAAKAVDNGHPKVKVVANLQSGNLKALRKMSSTIVDAEREALTRLEKAMQAIDRLASSLDGLEPDHLRDIASDLKTRVPALVAALH